MQASSLPKVLNNALLILTGCVGIIGIILSQSWFLLQDLIHFLTMTNIMLSFTPCNPSWLILIIIITVPTVRFFKHTEMEEYFCHQWDSIHGLSQLILEEKMFSSKQHMLQSITLNTVAFVFVSTTESLKVRMCLSWFYSLIASLLVALQSLDNCDHTDKLALTWHFSCWADRASQTCPQTHFL